MSEESYKLLFDCFFLSHVGLSPKIKGFWDKVYNWVYPIIGVLSHLMYLHLTWARTSSGLFLIGMSKGVLLKLIMNLPDLIETLSYVSYGGTDTLDVIAQSLQVLVEPSVVAFEAFDKLGQYLFTLFDYSLMYGLIYLDSTALGDQISQVLIGLALRLLSRGRRDAILEGDRLREDLDGQIKLFPIGLLQELHEELVALDLIAAEAGASQ